jgi:predicted transglutaminase-like cysteine proteinase
MKMASPTRRRPALLALAFLALLVCGAALSAVDLDKMQSLALSRYGPNTQQTVLDWRQLIVTITPLAEGEKLEAVNDFFNVRIRWVEDIDNWGENDYWATPLETMARRRGDCEDFSVAKFVTLLLGGVDMSKLRITYVKAQSGGPLSKNYIAHMVLAYYPTPSADPMILDNMVESVRPASQRADLKPVFGFNSNGLWVGGRAAPATKDPAAKLSRWRDLLQRMSADGLG